MKKSIQVEFLSRHARVDDDNDDWMVGWMVWAQSPTDGVKPKQILSMPACQTS